MTRRVPMRLVGLVAVAVVAVVGIAATGSDDRNANSFDPTGADWSEVVAEAQGQTVRLWMWGGEAALNDYIDDTVIPASLDAGVTLERVPIDDTATAMARLVSEADAGTSAGAIDLLWVNGKNFEQGATAGLWLDDWVSSLPNAALLDPDDPTLWNDFGVATQGREMPWSRAAFVFAHDAAAVQAPPRSFEELLEFARANPGRVTYPAPPDFTGSAFVRQAVAALGEDDAFAYLTELDPFLWEGGASYPVDQAEVERLFASDQIDLAMSYNPNFVDVALTQGSFAPTVVPYVFAGGTLSNVSFLAIPVRASSPQGAMVVADLMLGVPMQRAKLDLVGIPSVLAAETLGPSGDGSPYRLDDYGTALEELPAERVPAIDRRWLDEVG